jgi:ribonuclease P protein component
MSFFNFDKAERISLKRDIDSLFETGRAVSAGSIRFIYRSAMTRNIAVKVLITVPRKKFKKAVHRNRIKRLIREAWRLNRHQLLPLISSTVYLDIAFIYIGDKPDISFAEIESSLRTGFVKIARQLT